MWGQLELSDHLIRKPELNCSVHVRSKASLVSLLNIWTSSLLLRFVGLEALRVLRGVETLKKGFKARELKPLRKP